MGSNPTLSAKHLKEPFLRQSVATNELGAVPQPVPHPRRSRPLSPLPSPGEGPPGSPRWKRPSPPSQPSRSGRWPKPVPRPQKTPYAAGSAWRDWSGVNGPSGFVVRWWGLITRSSAHGGWHRASPRSSRKAASVMSARRSRPRWADAIAMSPGSRGCARTRPGSGHGPCDRRWRGPRG